LAIIISPAIAAKILKKHGVTEKEVYECFYNRTHTCLIDVREQHRSDPPTEWFIAETDGTPSTAGKYLKLAFIPRDGNLFLRTAFPVTNENAAEYFSVAIKDPDLG
jgi:hypothetical protein